MSNVLITGCGSGFGLLTAQKFARRGHQVFATVRDLSRAGNLHAMCDAEELPITILQLDVRDPASIQTAVSAALDVGPLDVLVNNAGYALRGPVEEVTDDEILAQFDTNVFGIVRMVRAVAPSMRERRSGVIVNISSLLAFAPAPFSGLYAASKAAVGALGESLHYELAPFGVRVAVIEPGSYPTNFSKNQQVSRASTAESPYAQIQQGFQAAAARLIGRSSPDPQEVADAVYDAVFAESPRFWYVVGIGAQQIAAVRPTTDFEGFERFFRNALDWHIAPQETHTVREGSQNERRATG